MRKNLNIKEGTIVEIKWIDSKGVSAEWEHKDELSNMKPCECWSIGYLERDDKDYGLFFKAIQTNK